MPSDARGDPMEGLHRLFTHEDAFHVHKVLGLVSLAHFAIRARSFSGPLDVGDHPVVYIGMLAVHSALSCSSMMFRIPLNRVRGRPMIWPEFRAHSILFAMRSIAACVLLFVSSTGDAAQSHPWRVAAALGRAALVMGTLVVADTIMKVLPPMKKDDPQDPLVGGGRTMRDMPHPEWMSPVASGVLTSFYSVSQLLATLNVLTTTQDAGHVFWTLLPIQLASLLMTLVRKGLIGSGAWHAVYSAALLVNVAYGVMHPRPDPSFRSLAIMVCVLRLGLRVDKYALWGGVSAAHIAAAVFEKRC